jgi:hypothetical protein
LNNDPNDYSYTHISAIPEIYLAVNLLNKAKMLQKQLNTAKLIKIRRPEIMQMEPYQSLHLAPAEQIAAMLACSGEKLTADSRFARHS